MLTERVHGFMDRLRVMLNNRRTWAVLLFAATSGAAFEGVGAVAGPFLLDQGLSADDVGIFFAVPAVVGMIVGAVAGGILADRVERRRAVAITLVFVVFIVFGLAAATASSHDAIRVLVPGLLAVLYVCIGMFTATSYALFMDATSADLGATQFSTYMGATNGCEMWSAYAVGKLHAALGYSVAFSMLATASALSLWILKGLRLQSKQAQMLQG
jgi:MFS transporter (putative signal transducer)